MRPIRLMMRGWMSYRDETTFEFPDGVFLLAGPTGSGKSALLDAMTFALYRQTPRMGARGLGALISQGSDRAVVELEFEARGRRYRVARELLPSKTSVRLERQGPIDIMRRAGDRWYGAPPPGMATAEDAAWESLADRTKVAEPMIEELVGQTYETFIRAAVLPQGRFAEMLTGDPARRRQVLTEILGLEVYEGIGKAARARARELEPEIAAAERAQARFVEAEREVQIAGLERKSAQLLAKGLDSRIALAEQKATAIALAAPAAEAFDLNWIAPAVDAAEQFERWQTRHDAEVERADAAYAAADQEWKRAHNAADESLVHDYPLQPPGRGLWEALERISDLQPRRLMARRAEIEAADRMKPLREQARLVTGQLAGLRIEHAAADVRSRLANGDLCPVCGDTYDARADLPELRGARALAAAEAVEAAATGALDAAKQAKAGAELAVEDLERRLHEAGAAADLEDYLDPVEVRLALDEEKRLQREYEGAVTQRARDEGIHRSNSMAAETARRDLVAAQDALAAARAGVAERPDRSAMMAAFSRAGLDPNSAADTCVLAEVEESVAGFRAWAQQAEDRVDELRIEARDAFDSDTDPAALAARWTSDREEARGKEAAMSSRVATLDEELERLRPEAEALPGLVAERAVNHQLERAMHADEFLAFAQQEVLERIVRAGSAELGELSAGRYALALTDAEEISVLDAWSGEMRPATTLSGGETFQAGVALALAVSDYAAGEAGADARLGCLFLDEGFGTLDPASLAAVGEALASLRAGGRVVGVISHVEALREVVGRTFEVRKTPAGSTIEEVAS